MASVRESPVCLAVLCGLPAAGKSSLARRVRELAIGLGWSFATVNYDQLIPEEAFESREERDGEPGGGETEWKRHRRAVLKCLDHFLNAAASDWPTGCDVISRELWEKCVGDLPTNPRAEPAAPVVFLLDDNFYYRSMRYEVYSLCRKNSLGFCQIFLACDWATCNCRNRERACPVPGDVIQEMERRLEPPNATKNPWERNSVRLDTSHALSAADVEKVLDLISSALENPESPLEDDTEQKEADRVKCANSVLHQADQSCRKLISDAMKTARGRSVSHLKPLASELNELKSDFLQDLKTRLLQDFSGENLEPNISAALDDFDQNKTKILRKFLENDT